MTVAAEPLVLHAIDDMLRLTALVEHERNPIEALRNLLLDMRLEVREA